MRIIDERDEARFKCRSCNSILGVEAKDIREYSGGFFFTCPKCKAQNLLPKTLIPARWWDEIEPTGC